MSDRRMSILQKVMKRVEISTALSFHGTPCWIWTGPTSGQIGRGAGYPRMSLSGCTVAVHLVMYSNFFGYIPWNKTVDHECSNRLCVNPDHLSLVSMKENYRRRDGKAPRKGTEYAVALPQRYVEEVREALLNQLGVAA